MLKKILFSAQAIVLGFFLCSCSSQETKIKWELVKVGSIKLPIDTLTRSFQINHHVYKDTLLIVLNSEQNSLLFYDLKREKLNKILKFDREGENGVNIIEAFLYTHPDSIYLISSHQYKIHHFNEEKKLLKTYNILKNNKLDKDAALPLNNFQAQPVKIGNYLHLATYPYVNYSRQEAYYTKKIHLILNLESGEVDFSPISYPRVYREKPFPVANSYFFRTFNAKEQKFIYSFRASEELMIEDNLSKKIQAIRASVSITKMTPPASLSRFTENDAEHTKVYNSSNEYIMTLYEPSLRVYIRVAQKKSDDFFVWYAVVLDEHFQKNNETEIFKVPKQMQGASFLPPFAANQKFYFPSVNNKSEDFFEMNTYEIITKE